MAIDLGFRDPAASKVVIGAVEGLNTIPQRHLEGSADISQSRRPRTSNAASASSRTCWVNRLRSSWLSVFPLTVLAYVFFKRKELRHDHYDLRAARAAGRRNAPSIHARIRLRAITCADDLTASVVIVALWSRHTLQNIALFSRHRARLSPIRGSEANVSNLNSFSLALLLGGLRGPLVMLLWTSSEIRSRKRIWKISIPRSS